MIPSDIRLYTWVDVEEVLVRLQKEGHWQEWLVWVRAYWDSLTIGIRPGFQTSAKQWLSNLYDPRFRSSSESNLDIAGYIILESLPGNERTLPIVIEETQENPPVPRLEPSLSKPSVLTSQQNLEFPPSFTSEFPPIIAFHSFKGGVGRTTHAIALARALSNNGQKVLLVDGDLEAPGISWLLEQRLPFPPVSFADLLALVHGAVSPDAQGEIQLVADRLQGALIDGIYVLPSFHSVQTFNSLEIRPEHLIQGSENPFILTQVLAELGKKLAVNAVIIDLRAGLSELSAGLLLDPRIYRVFVTTPSGQSIEGTVRLLEILASRALSTRDEDPLPALIVTQVPDDRIHENLVEEADTKLIQAIEQYVFVGDSQEILGVREPPKVITNFTNNLLVLPLSWEEIIARLDRSGIVEKLNPLLEWLPGQRQEIIQEASLGLRDQRIALRDFSQKLVVAETTDEEDFLATSPLRRLASDHRRQIPIVVMVGAKGSGKTYTFLQLVRRGKWQTFIRDISDDEIQVNADIYPVLASKNLPDAALALVRQARCNTAEKLGFSNLENTDIIRDYIRDACQEELHEGQWRERWLDVIAWGIGFHPQEKDAGRELANYLAEKEQKLVVIIDGLEDLFQDFTSDKAQQMALRALLQEVPEWLGQQPGRPLGIAIFIRRDMVLASVRQNAAQMMARYDPYALKWNREEALKLVAWVAQKAGTLSNLKDENLQNLVEEELVQTLIPLWGKKLGTDRSKEATTARFVIAALSDFRGQIQARDIVRLLYVAARDSVNDNRWQDRILTPTAIRGALPECSREKVNEIKTENTALNNIFDQLQNLSSDLKKIPFAREDMNLSSDDMKILEDNGIVIREEDEYYMPEIFRFGLNFSMRAGARPKVLSLARGARQRS